MFSSALFNDEIITYIGTYTIGASGAHTKVTDTKATGISSVVQTGTAGQYRINLVKGAPVGPLVNAFCVHWPAANAAPLVVRPNVNGYTKETAAAGATMVFEAFDLETPARTELASGDRVTYVLQWQKTKA
jgi:hypothetical protein